MSIDSANRAFLAGMAAGSSGPFTLKYGEEVLGVYDTADAAMDAWANLKGARMYGASVSWPREGDE